MDIISILSSLNKISLIAFIITSAFLSYQVYLIKQELSKKRDKPLIPDFNDKTVFKRQIEQTVFLKQKPKLFLKEKNSIYFTFLISFLIIFLVIFALSGIANLMVQKKTVNIIQPTPIVNFVASRGIRVYNDNWVELTEQQLQNLNNNQKLFLGIETIKDVDIDMARIRVNETVWKGENVTNKFNKEKNVFYKDYTVGSQSAFLKIDVQLHSKSEGWLGE